MSNVKQISFDIKTDNEGISDSLMKKINALINSENDYEVLGTSNETDITEIYKNRYPDLLGEEERKFGIRISVILAKELIVPAHSYEEAKEKVENSDIVFSEEDIIKDESFDIDEIDYIDDETIQSLDISEPFINHKNGIFAVKITKTLNKTVFLKAENEKDAIEKVKEKTKEGLIVVPNVNPTININIDRTVNTDNIDYTSYPF